MQTSDQGRQLITEREGCRLTPYRDSRGVWTDGVGNTHGVRPYDGPITQKKADNDLRMNLRVAEAAVNLVTRPLEQFQFDALVSFVFNVGVAAFERSTLFRLLNAGDIDGATGQFDLWHIPPEITSRRNGEREQFKGEQFAARIEGEDHG